MVDRMISGIKVVARHRHDMGDISGLAKSIDDVGLLHPIVVRPGGTLIAGERRLLACQELGWTKIPVHEVEVDLIARGELAENADRKDFLPSEIEAIRRTLEPEMKAAAKERYDATRPGVGGKLPPTEKGKTRDKLAAFAGVSGRTIEKIAAVVAAAEAEPERFGKLVADMDRTGRVDGPFKRLKVAKQSAAIRAEPPPLPQRGPYRVLVVDPPWPYELRKADPSHRATHPYPQMSIVEICALEVASIAHSDAIVWLWTTNHHMRESYAVLDAWGFESKTILTWGKNRFGTGDWLRGQTEHCHLAVRGNAVVQLTNQSTLLLAPMRANSEKPAEFYPFVESLCPAPRYATLFHRGLPNERWDGHGDEATEAVHAVA